VGWTAPVTAGGHRPGRGGDALGGEASDLTLVRTAREGDDGALEQLLARHSGFVWAVCRRLVGNDADAADAAQAALIKVVFALDGFDGRSELTSWLYRIAANAALDEMRRRRRRPAVVAEVPEAPAGAGGAEPERGVVDRAALGAALDTLAGECRAAIVLRDVLGYDYATIATMLAVPAATIRSRVARGRARMAEVLVETA
jgi:RNA polymerase sigma-70 factor (ECF subfamily)